MPTAGEPLPEVNVVTSPDKVMINANEKAIEAFKALEQEQVGVVNAPLPDMLAELFRMQTVLNDKTFAKHGIGFPNTLTTAKMKAAVEAGDLGPNSLPNTWMQKYLWALTKECGELDEKLLKKWWSKDSVDLQQARVEIIDQLHFWISLAMASGMTAEDVFRIYVAKNKVNTERQDTGYSVATKKPDDGHIK